MKWEKRGLIFAPDKELWWQQYYGILPTPVYLSDLDVIRVFFSSACKDKFGRISYIDLDPANPNKIITQTNEIVLDLGTIGAFDDSGVIPSSILKHKNSWMLFYAGYQRHVRTPYSILSGLAISNDCLNFSRFQQIPILERTATELSIRSAPTIIFEDGIFKMWYNSDFGWIEINSSVFKNKLMPQYCIKYGESTDALNWTIKEGNVILPKDDEFGFGRPWIYKKGETYLLFYSVRKINETYRIGYAESNDAVNWVRKDDEIGIDVSETGWDSEMICYPAVIDVRGKTYLFYNGNNNGETGFGYAELVND